MRPGAVWAAGEARLGEPLSPPQGGRGGEGRAGWGERKDGEKRLEGRRDGWEK